MKLITMLFMLATALLGVDLQSDTTVLDRPTLPVPTTATVVSEVPRSRSKATTTTTTVYVPPVPVSSVRLVPGIDDALYPEWWLVALDAGWPADHLPILDDVLYRESRGTVDVIGTGAYGLTQIQWNAHHEWITELFGVTDPTQLFDPLLNLQVAWHLHQMAHDMYGCGWQPWYMSGNWC